MEVTENATCRHVSRGRVRVNLRTRETSSEPMLTLNVYPRGPAELGQVGLAASPNLDQEPATLLFFLLATPRSLRCSPRLYAVLSILYNYYHREHRPSCCITYRRRGTGHQARAGVLSSGQPMPRRFCFRPKHHLRSTAIAGYTHLTVMLGPRYSSRKVNNISHSSLHAQISICILMLLLHCKDNHILSLASKSKLNM